MGTERELLAVEEIHQATLKILAEIGVEFGSREVNDLFKQHGFRQENGRTFFTEEQVNKYINMATKEFTVYGRDESYSININTEETHYCPGYGAPRIINKDGSVRDALFDDYLKMANLFHMEKSFNVNGGILVQPGDIEADISIPVMIYAAMKRSSKVLFGIQGTKEDNNHIYKMLEIVFGGKEALREKARYIPLCTPTSPLRVDESTIDTLLAGCEYNQPIAVCSACMPGGTAPVTLAGAVAMCNAEILSTIILTQLVNPGNPVLYEFACYGSNVQTGNASIGSPELIKAGRYGSLLAKKYGFACRSGGGLSDARGVTAQAGIETAMCLFHSNYYKANLVMHAAGILDSFAAMSYEKVMLDFEVIDRCANYFEDLEVSEVTLAFDTLKKVAQTGATFLNQKHTVKNCRKAYVPQVSLRSELPEGMDPNEALYESMNNRMEKQLAAYVKPELASDVEEKLDDYMLALGMRPEDMKKV
ncbi:MAG: trimethylamine methyltransferase family protein [Bacillota bacterium]|nr:trimethylamine methyltransferase family protein [Bacillota bacterium]MDW7684498.1 trimethylamine methyltransferase family protein [Bacillota bacterium]